jgi:DNA-binding transcriptional regulator YhcF (GntR family)
MILTVDLGSPLPPYEQIRAQITTMAGSGVLTPGTRLPAIRQLAADLGLAAGTVARAYRELESAGIIATRGRHGTHIARPPVLTPGQRVDQLHRAAASYAHRAGQLGAGPEETIRVLRQVMAHLTRPAARKDHLAPRQTSAARRRSSLTRTSPPASTRTSRRQPPGRSAHPAITSLTS